jgi:hypothetical protein
MRHLLPLLPKPSRYAGIEDNACRKNLEDVRLRVALAFPDTYDVGMAVLETLGTPETLRQRIGLLKTAQIFADGQSYPE